MISIRGINLLLCVNSWGAFDTHPNIKVDQEENCIFKVSVSFTRLKCDYSNLDSEGTVYIDDIESG